MYLSRNSEQNFIVKTHNKSILDVEKFEYLGVFRAEYYETKKERITFFFILARGYVSLTLRESVV
jgi:hypothetical protein